jgi:uncharacterized protein (DUF4415 family)
MGLPAQAARWRPFERNGDRRSPSARPPARTPMPEITDDMLARAELRKGERLVGRGRPRSAAPKQAIKLRLDPDVLAYFRNLGPGWQQTRINATLRRAAKLKKTR